MAVRAIRCSRLLGALQPRSHAASLRRLSTTVAVPTAPAKTSDASPRATSFASPHTPTAQPTTHRRTTDNDFRVLSRTTALAALDNFEFRDDASYLYFDRLLDILTREKYLSPHAILKILSIMHSMKFFPEKEQYSRLERLAELCLPRATPLETGLLLSKFLNLTFADGLFVSDLCENTVLKFPEMPISIVVSNLEDAANFGYNKVFLFLHNVCRTLLDRYDQLTISQKKNILWALARCEYVPNNSLVDRIFQDVIHNDNAFTLAEITVVAWAAAVLRLWNEELFRAIDSSVLRRADDPTAHVNEFATLLWSFATMNAAPSPTLWDRATQAILHALSSPSAAAVPIKTITRLGWSAVVTQRFDVKLLSPLCKAALVAITTTYCNEFQISQLRYLVKSLRLECKEPIEGLNELDRHLRTLPITIPPGTASRFARDILEALRIVTLKYKLGAIQEEQIIDDLMRVDFAIPSRRIAIEAQGPFHFVHNGSHPVGTTLLRRRLLRAMGWTVVEINYVEWGKLEHSLRVQHVDGLLQAFAQTTEK